MNQIQPSPTLKDQNRTNLIINWSNLIQPIDRLTKLFHFKFSKIKSKVLKFEALKSYLLQIWEIKNKMTSF